MKNKRFTVVGEDAQHIELLVEIDKPEISKDGYIYFGKNLVTMI